MHSTPVGRKRSHVVWHLSLDHGAVPSAFTSTTLGSGVIRIGFWYKGGVWNSRFGHVITNKFEHRYNR